MQVYLLSYLSKQLPFFSQAKCLESLLVDFHLLNCELRYNFQKLTIILFFNDKITIQFLHCLRSQINTGFMTVEGQSQFTGNSKSSRLTDVL